MARGAAGQAGERRPRLSSAATTPLRAVSGPPIYVASPLGFSEAGTRYLNASLHPALYAAGFSIHDPWASGAEIHRALRDADLATINAALGAANSTLIETSKGVLAVLDGSDVDSGTAAEIGYAAALGKVVVGLRTDFRMAGDNADTPVNLQVMHFITTSGGAFTTSIEKALRALGASVPGPFPNERLFHIASKLAWHKAKRSGSYERSTRGQSLAEVGFIHCSYRGQLTASADRFYKDADAEDLIVLAIDPALLDAPLVVEPAASGENFPHIHGALNPSAVLARCELIRVDGHFALGRARKP